MGWMRTRLGMLWKLCRISLAAGEYLFWCVRRSASLNYIPIYSRTVIASLHQPRSDIYNMGDNYMILAKVRCLDLGGFPLRADFCFSKEMLSTKGLVNSFSPTLLSLASPVHPCTTPPTTA